MSFAEALVQYRALAEASGEIAIKGKANPYTSMNGNMFSFLDKDGQLCLRVSDEDRAAFNATHGTGPVLQYGAVMKQYIGLPHTVLDDTDASLILFRKSIAHAETLPPKPTKAKKAR